MDFIRIDNLPRLRRGILIAAFAGWGDAGEIATLAARHLIAQFNATKFAGLDPEEFYDFTKTRPTTTIVNETERRLEWPANDFYYWRDEGGRDFVVLVGNDPQLRWKRFVDGIIEVAKEVGVEQVLTLGGYLGEVPHSRIAPFTGRSNRPELEARLVELSVMPSNYQGPTGIHSILMNACEQAGLPNASIWGAVPHYIPMIANPKVCAALLRRIGQFLELEIDTHEMDEAGRRFERQVNEAIADNAEVAAYVSRLEANTEFDVEENLDETPGDLPELPSGDVVLRDLEEFLRQQRGQNESPD